MPSYFFRLDDPSRKREEVECASIEDAQTLAIQYLGDYLIRHPEFAQEGHWKLIVENDSGQPYLHVIVAAVRDRNSPPDIANEDAGRN
jgi:hypothetical protein